MNYDRIREALPVESGNGRRSTIRARSDVVEVVIDCVLRRRQFKEIAQRCCVDLESLTRFRKRFITPEVEKIVLVEANKLDADALDQGLVQEAIPELPVETQGIFAVYPPGRFTQPKVRAFIDFLVHSFADKGPDAW